MHHEVQLTPMVYQKGQNYQHQSTCQKKKKVHCYILGVYP